MLVTYYPDIATLAAMISHSQIVVPQIVVPQILLPQPPQSFESLPAGYEETDIVILAWIAAEGRRVGREFARM